MRYHLTPARMGIIKKDPETINAGEGVERRTLPPCWWECKLIQPLRRTVGRLLKKTKKQCYHMTLQSHNWAYVRASACSAWLRVTLWIIASQAPLSLGFSRWEYWSGLPCLSAGDPPNPGIKPKSASCIGRQVLYYQHHRGRMCRTCQNRTCSGVLSRNAEHVYSKENMILKDTCVPMFTAAMLTTTWERGSSLNVP